MNNIIAGLAERSESFYLYDENDIRSQIRKLQNAFPGIDLLYSVKCNPNRGILQAVFSCGLGADAASPGEVLLAERAGLGKNRIFYSAPGKTAKDIARTIDSAVLIADSLCGFLPGRPRMNICCGKTATSKNMTFLNSGETGSI